MKTCDDFEKFQTLHKNLNCDFVTSNSKWLQVVNVFLTPVSPNLNKNLEITKLSALLLHLNFSQQLETIQ
jgi:hypothetical protein